MDFTKLCKKSDTILDTHLGSGSSRIACYDMGFDFIGTEIDREYFEGQEKGLKLIAHKAACLPSPAERL